MTTISRTLLPFTCAAVLGLAAACDTADEPGPAEAEPEAAAVTVVMEDMSFSTEAVEIEPGETVEFVNQDGVVHDVAFDDGESSPDLEEGDRYRRTFDADGEYAFECTYHPAAMQGTVLVGDAAASGEADDGRDADEGAADDDTDTGY